MTDAHPSSEQRMSCIYRAGCPKPNVCKEVGHCTSMGPEDLAYEKERDKRAAEYDRHIRHPSTEELAAQKAAARDKRRYVKFSCDGSHCIVTPDEADQMAKDGDWGEYQREDVWMTEAEFEALPEFGGF